MTNVADISDILGGGGGASDISDILGRPEPSVLDESAGERFVGPQQPPVDARDFFHDLLESGIPPEEAQGRVQQLLAERREQARLGPSGGQIDIGPPSSLAEGALRGVSAGFSDELQGVLGSGEFSGPGFQTERDISRAESSAAEEANPAAFSAGQIAGGTALAAPLLPFTGAAGAIGGGAALGGLTAAGESEAELGEGEFGEFATDVGIGVGLGGALGGVAHGAVKGAGRLIDKARGLSAARGLAGEVAEDIGGLSGLGVEAGEDVSVRESIRSGRELERKFSREIGEQFEFSPGQLTGKQSIALAEKTAAEAPGTMDAAARAGLKRLRNITRVGDNLIERLAGNPELLGKSGVGTGAVSAINAELKAMRAIRSGVADPLYEAAELAAGDARIFSTGNVRAAVESFTEGLPPGSELARGQLSRLTSKADSSGAVKYSAIKNARSFWSKLSQGGASVSETTGKTTLGMSPRETRRLGTIMMKAIDDDLAASAQGRAVAGEAAGFLKQANDVWAQHSKLIDSNVTNTVGRILKIGEGDALDTIPKKLLASSEDQIRGVFSILNRADPRAAGLMRAQFIEDVLAKAGKTTRTEARGVISATKAFTELNKNTGKIMAALEGDPAAKLAYKELVQGFERLKFKPRVQGSDTFQKQQQLAAELRSSGGTVGAAISKAGGVWRAIFGNDKARAEVLSSAGGIKNFNKLINAELKGASRTDKIVRNAINGLKASFASAGAQEGIDIIEEHFPGKRRGIAKSADELIRELQGGAVQ